MKEVGQKARPDPVCLKASTKAKKVSSSTTASRDAKSNCDMRFNVKVSGRRRRSAPMTG